MRDGQAASSREILRLAIPALGALLADDAGELRPPAGRETATAVISALAMMHGAWGVRVHDVGATVDALKVVEAWETAPTWEGETGRG